MRRNHTTLNDIPEGTFSTVKTLAKREHRTISMQILALVEEALRTRENNAKEGMETPEHSPATV